mmetsp:Transcript_8629/g.21617  ORF Transcript_8629/g.21617 Transcript_8629/m.21617 type:complete len:808 (-) Transcript_8629:165-2588(-)
MDDEEPPSLSKAPTGPPSAPPAGAFGSAPPAGAFAAHASSSGGASSGSAPPPSAFSHRSSGGGGGGAVTAPSVAVVPPAAAAADDLNARWKQHEEDMELRRTGSSISASGRGSSGNGTNSSISNKLVTTASPAATTSNFSDGISPRRTYSFTKSSSTSYDTNELIKKYSGVTGLVGTTPPVATASSPARTSSNAEPPSPASYDRSSPTAAADRAVREEAMNVLNLADDYLNSPMNVRRTETGGFRASLGVEGSPPPITTDRSDRRTPSALAGLGLTRTMSNSSQRSHGSRGSRSSRGSHTSWKGPNGRFSFKDTNYHDDDYMSNDEEDAIVTKVRPHPALGSSKASEKFHDEPSMGNVEIDIGVRKSNYSDYPDANFGAGDFPGKSSSWSSRYNTTKNTTKMLDQWDTDYRNSSSQRERQSARNMFMSSAHNMLGAASSMGEKMATGSARVFGSGFSFRQNNTFGQQQEERSGLRADDGTNLRTVWKDIADDHDDMHSPGPRVNKTWQEVMQNKRKRRRILMSSICIALAAIALGLAFSPAINPNREKTASFPGSTEGSTITFYATSDTPFDGDEEEKLAKDLIKIPNDAEFVMHLGNMQDAGVTMCPETHAAESAAILRKSPVPVMVVPGEHDWVNCPYQENAFMRWMASFGAFQLAFPNTMTYSRSENHPEIFMVLHKGVLIFGLHLVNGRVEDAEALDFLNEDMKNFFVGMLNDYKDQYRAIVIMGNARPGPRQKLFFDSLSTKLSGVPAPVAYVHANNGISNDIVTHTPFADLDIMAIQVPKGGDHPPLKITVGYGSEPFIVG